MNELSRGAEKSKEQSLEGMEDGEQTMHSQGAAVPGWQTSLFMCRVSDGLSARPTASGISFSILLCRLPPYQEPQPCYSRCM